MAALEILNLYIQTFKTRVDSLNYEEKIPANMRKYIASILFCDGRVEIKELSTICAQIRRRYGAALNDLSEDVDPRISSRLTPCIPNPSDVSETLQDILRKNGVTYQSLEPEVNPLTQFIKESIHNLPDDSPAPSYPVNPQPAPYAFPTPGMPTAPDLSSVPSVPSAPSAPNAFPVMPNEPAIPPMPAEPLMPPGGFGSMPGETGAPSGRNKTEPGIPDTRTDPSHRSLPLIRIGQTIKLQGHNSFGLFF